jgi:hypothetical protein
MLLENLKWPEVKRIDFSKTPVVIPAAWNSMVRTYRV